VRLKQVLNNLLANAFKFTDRGGVSLRIRPGRPKATGSLGSADAAELLFEVEDTGIGIPAAVQPKLFEAFSQVEIGGPGCRGGTGLGLHISRQIVEMMSGRIDFRSQAGRGSTFRFSATFALDKRERAPAPEREAGDEAEPSPDLRVLIVEDHPINQKVLEGMLSLHGLKPDRASDGAQALDACSRKSYDLVLMDSHMPGMDGYECTRKLRERQSPKGKPVIIGVTADAMSGSRERCLEAGMDEMITKPVMDRDLLRVLARLKPGAAPEPAHWVATPPPEPGRPEELVDYAQMEEMNHWILQYKPGFWDKARMQFDDAYRRQMRALRDAFVAGRFQEAGDAAHAFKGVCFMLGFRRMGEICSSLEAIGLGADHSRWREFLADLEAARDPSLRAWNDWIRR
jgi:CheY-like chemotaxis protein/HPt (histidine-containing phosphotransfer) domain-containing protein